MINIIKASKDHLNNCGENPQTYTEHGIFAIANSLILIIAGTKGIIHGLLPFLFPFATSTTLIKSFKKLVDSQRHSRELQEIMPEDYLYKKHLE
jgi:hypothetical protein